MIYGRVDILKSMRSDDLTNKYWKVKEEASGLAKEVYEEIRDKWII
jgi:hypothetical protein